MCSIDHTKTVEDRLDASGGVGGVCAICGERSAHTVVGTREGGLVTRHGPVGWVMEDVVCERCGFVFARGVPDETQLLTWYREAHRTRSEYQEALPDFDQTVRLKLVQAHMSTGATVLEIGAHTGTFCDTLRAHGYRAVGIDPLAPDSAGRVDPGSTPRVDQPFGQPVDAIVSYYVLEHVVDVRAWLQAAKDRLQASGVIILEVPDFARWPVESLHPEHLSHFTPVHLERLMASAGFDVVSIDACQPSRYFGCVRVGRLQGPQRTGSRTDWRPSDEECAQLVAFSKQRYRDAVVLRDQEEHRQDAVAVRIQDRIAAMRPKQVQVFFWAANAYATGIARKLTQRCDVEIVLVDNAETKIGTRHEGFTHPIRPPVLPRQDTHHRVFVLCSPAWNWQIAQRIQEIALDDITVIDGVSG